MKFSYTWGVWGLVIGFCAAQDGGTYKLTRDQILGTADPSKLNQNDCNNYEDSADTLLPRNDSITTIWEDKITGKAERWYNGGATGAPLTYDINAVIYCGGANLLDYDDFKTNLFAFWCNGTPGSDGLQRQPTAHWDLQNSKCVVPPADDKPPGCGCKIGPPNPPAGANILQQDPR